MSLRPLLLPVALFAAGCVANAGGPDPVMDGHAVAARADCAVCHAIPDVEPPGRTSSCVGCHVWIRSVSGNPAARAAAMSVFPLWERYERNVVSYFDVPDLGAAFSRLDPAWLVTYLADPYDVRPALPETMVRLGLDEAGLTAIAAWAAAVQVPVAATPPPSPDRVATGEQLFRTRGCPACHTFGALTTGPGIASAPDLRHARDRMTDDRIVAWIEDPLAVSPRAAMPELGLSRDEAIAVRDWLVLADPGGVPAPSLSRDVPASPARVTWAEVNDRIFGKICAHCHMDPAQNEGRVGPGNGGGFGWPATGIELQTWEGTRKHGPAILAAVLRRREEVARDLVGPGQVPVAIQRPHLPGMPLGLPPLPEEDIALLRAWVEQGMPE